jgi:amino acid adenylation domain-containing protein
MGNFSKRLQSLTSERRALLARQLPPASFAQTRMWFLNSLNANSAYYTVSAGLELRGALDRQALEKAFHEIVRRHEVLRSNFVMLDGSLVQCVHAAELFAVEFIDLQGWSLELRLAEAKRIAKELAHRPFDLEDDFLIRIQLLKLQETHHILVVAMHHVVSDGWSIGVLINELTILYDAYRQGAASPLPPLAWQYSDYSRWQHKWLEEKRFEQEVEYWKEKLKNAPSFLPLPADRPSPAHRSFYGGHGSVLLNPATVQKLKTFARQQAVTEFMLFLAAFNVLLARYSGQTDICIGTPVAGRNIGETEKLIGLFVNTLVMRTDLSGNPPFVGVLERVKESSLDAFAHQTLPFEKLVEILQPERGPNFMPFFQVMFVLQNSPATALVLKDLAVSAWEFENDMSQFDLTLMVVETLQGVYLTYEYSSELFDVATVEQMFRSFEVLLDNIGTLPKKRISELPLRSSGEREQVLRQSQGKRVEFSKSETLIHLFEKQARKTPDAIAVECDGKQLTYFDLNQRANQLSHYLKKAGIGAEAPVGVCISRSFEMVIAILGIVKAGGAYVPLEPEDPAERIQYILEDAGIQVLLTEQSVGRKISRYSGRLIYMDRDWEEIAPKENHDPGNVVFPENLAYVIYTSGSTGRPKGVAVSHQSLSNLIHWHVQNCGLSNKDRLSQIGRMAFDASVIELWPPLIVGACLCLAREIGPDLLRWVADRGITTAFLVTPLAEMALVAPELKQTSLRTLVTGGDVLKQRPSRDLQLVFMNYYGPTEATCVTTAEVVEPENGGSAIPSIGRPIANATAYVLNEENEPVPPGVTGELFIGGIGVARGYLGRPDLTAERFVPDPFSNNEGERMYRTGDAVRYDRELKLKFQGRLDSQVKIQGFRIELGEIEKTLLHLPGIQQAAVIARQRGDNKSLVACIVADEGMELNAAKVQDRLKEQLPEYMVPQIIFMLPALPLTANGKVDSKALLELVEQETQVPAYVAPRNETEAKLVTILEELLKREHIGVEDNFFHLGGHSLLAAQAISKIRGVFHAELQVRHIFEAPTVAQLASAIVHGRAQGNESRIDRRLSQEAPEAILGRLENLDEEEVERLLEEVLTEEE